MFTDSELSSLLTIMSLLKNEYRDALVPHEIDGDRLDALHDRVLAETKIAVGVDKIMGKQLYCALTLQRPYWKHTDLGVGKVCNAPVNADGSCPNARQHADNVYGEKIV